MVVVILGNTDSFVEHELVRRAVEERNEETFVVEVQDWPGNGFIEYTIGSGKCRFDRQFSLDEVTGVFSMIPSIFSARFPVYEWLENVQERVGYKQLREWQQMFRSMIAVFKEYGARVPVLPTDRYWDFHRPWMLELYASNGIPIPNTRFTNDPEHVKEFVKKYSKVLVQPINEDNTNELIQSSDLSIDRLADLTATPIALQEYIPGDNWRGYVIGEELIGVVEYESKPDVVSLTNSTPMRENVKSTPVCPDSDLRKKIIHAAEFAPSTYVAVDVRIRKNGDFAVLKSTTSGCFAAHDLAGSTNIAGKIAEYLIDP